MDGEAGMLGGGLGCRGACGVGVGGGDGFLDTLGVDFYIRATLAAAVSVS